MSDEHFEQNVSDLKKAFGDVATTTAADGRRLVKIKEVELPRGCKPGTTPMMVVLQNGARPVVYAKPGITLANGAAPRSTSNVAVEGETWLQFSYNFPWDENSHTLVQFVASSVRRFALNE